MSGGKKLRNRFIALLLVWVPLFLSSACVTVPPPTTSTAEPPTSEHSDLPETAKNESTGVAVASGPTTPKVDKEQIEDSEDLPETPQSAADIENLTIDEVIRIEEPNTTSLYDNSRYDFPITVNSKVEGWIDYFTGRGRPHMERYLSRSSRYIPLMKQVLKKAGMPEDLVYLALIESGFNLRAKSRARAVGPWQFIKGTGQRYGLRVDGWVDERRDPLRSTEAAAKYLKDLYLMFESWYLAASAYNAGEYKILRAIEELKTNNFWGICQTHLFRRETKDYVPKLIAAAIIAKNPARYGFSEITYQDPMEFDLISVDFPIPLKDLAKIVDAPEDEIEDLNPELRRSMVPPGSSYEVRIPVGSRVLAERALAVIRSKFVRTDLPVQYTVKYGDTLNSVANKYRLRARDLANANNLNLRERLAPGSSLIIPSQNERSAAPAARVTKVRRATSSASIRNPAGFITHVVRRGESLWSISEKYNVTVQEIFRWNNLKRSRIQPGRRLRIRSGAGGDDEA
jgi:membrane-bound lytic murein transglycosylase D